MRRPEKGRLYRKWYGMRRIKRAGILLAPVLLFIWLAFCPSMRGMAAGAGEGETPEELAQSGIRPNTIRLSIGTEHIDDILADLAAALEA